MKSLTELPGLEGQGYIFTQNGFVQMIEHGSMTGMPVAATRKAAKTLVRRMTRMKGVSIAAVGSVPGETLDSHARLAAQQGAHVFLTRDGKHFDVITYTAA